MVVIDSGAFDSFVAEPLLKSNYWLVASTEPVSIWLATGSDNVSDLICTIPIVFLM